MTDMSFAQAALAYTEPEGLRPAWKIIRLGDYDGYKDGPKKPRAGSHGWKDASDDPAQIAVWWKETPRANIGLATGEINGVLVFDWDRNHGDGTVDGLATKAQLEKVLGPLPSSVQALTPSGGLHDFFKYPTGHSFGCMRDDGTNNYAHPGFDIRGNGGYVVLSPSARVLSGKVHRYEWELSSPPEDVALAELPPPWITFLEQWMNGVPMTGFRLPADVKEGSRNNTLFRYASRLRAKGVGPEEMGRMVREYNRDHCHPALDDREVNTILRSVERYKLGQSRTTAAEDFGTAEDGGTRKKKNPPITIESLAGELASRGVTVKFNIITRNFDVSGKDPTTGEEFAGTDALISRLHSDLRSCYTGITADTLRSYISYIAMSTKYNPVLDKISAVPWDGIDRLPVVFDLLGIMDDDLSQTLMQKWLYQTIALQFNGADGKEEPFGSDGLLVFQGEQGWGKSSFLRRLALSSIWFGDGMVINERDKDTKRRVITKWISELGEVDQTIRKSDPSELKSFITAARDEYRLPYGRNDVNLPRTASIAGTCNKKEFLIDETGNRRWWTIPFNRLLQWEDLEALDSLQLWAQIYALIAPMSYKEKSTCFRLSVEEREALGDRNKEYEKPRPGLLEVKDILSKADDNSDWPTQRMTVSEFISMWPILSKFSPQAISKALREADVPVSRSHSGMTAVLPVNKEYQLKMLKLRNEAHAY